MPRKHFDGDGDGEPLGPELGVPVVGAPDDGAPVGVPGALPLGVELAGALVRGWADGLVDGFFPPGVAFGLVAAWVAVVPGPAGPEVRAAPDALCDGTRLAAGVLAVEGPAGAWFAAGVPVNAPETSSATRPALATTAAPTATAAPVRRRGFPCGSPGGCPGPGGPVGRDMRGGTFHSSET
jgi:hypothetical protein